MITATEAINLMPSKKIDAILNALDEQIHNAAKNDRTSIRISSISAVWPEIFNEVTNYVYHNNPSELMKSVLNTMTKHGYHIQSLYEERQFVDIDIIIEWKNVE